MGRKEFVRVARRERVRQTGEAEGRKAGTGTEGGYIYIQATAEAGAVLKHHHRQWPAPLSHSLP